MAFLKLETRNSKLKPQRRVAAALLLLALGAAAAEPSPAVPAEVATLLSGLAKAKPTEVIARIDDFKGPQHALLTLSRAQARFRLHQDAQDPTAAARLLDSAHADFTATLGLDATLVQAHLGLAQCAAAREDWTTALRHAGQGIDPGTADRSQVTFLASLALKAGDWRVATLAAQHGILRFSDSPELRRLELAVLVHAGRGEDARQAVLALLAQAPGDAALWRHLAWSAQQTGRDEESVAALEAALALVPADRSLRRQVAEAQCGRGQPQAALITVRPLMGDPPLPEALGDDGLMLLASHIASEGGGDAGVAQARTWLAAVPIAARSRAQRLQAARLAVRAGDSANAAEVLDALVAAGEADPTVLTWAAALADGQGDHARAEALYLRASAVDSPAAGPAALRLAALYLKQDRPAEAGVILATYLAKKPDDVQARALHAQVERRR